MNTQTTAQTEMDVSEKKRYLSRLVSKTVSEISVTCLSLIDDADSLDNFLQKAIVRLPYCTLVYVTDKSFCQSSSNIRLGRIESQYRGQNLSSRPYLQGTIPLKGLVLSDSYTDTYTSMTCITVVQAIQYNNDLQGLLIADFNLDALPLQTNHSQFINHSRQFKGDPAIRGSLFNQQRVSSLLDTHIIKVHEVVEKLVTHYGAFHFKLHYSSSRISLWLYDQPHHYRLHNISDLLDETVFLYYPKRLYPEDACVDDTALSIVLSHFMALRFIDDNAYLRSASLNIINGMVGLNFSCDGSHYLPAEDFIENSLDYWQGSLAENKTINT